MNFKLFPTKDIYGNTLADLGENNPDIFVVEADLMKASGSRPFMLKFPDRHINVGIAEQNLVGVAAGLALMNRIPFACTFSNFMSQRACDQVFLGASYNNLNVKLVGCYSGLSSERNGGTHASIIDIAVMRSLPNMKVIVPADLNELKQAIISTTKDKGPTYIRMSRLLPENIFTCDYNFEIGKSYVIKEGSDITLISTGLTTHIALMAIEELEKNGISVELIHMPTLKPVDSETIIKSAGRTRGIITIENHSIYAGLGSLISEITSSYCPVKVLKIGINDTFGLTADLDFQLKYFGLSVENILAKAKELLKV